VCWTLLWMYVRLRSINVVSRLCCPGRFNLDPFSVLPSFRSMLASEPSKFVYVGWMRAWIYPVRNRGWIPDCQNPRYRSPGACAESTEAGLGNKVANVEGGMTTLNDHEQNVCAGYRNRAQESAENCGCSVTSPVADHVATKAVSLSPR
jgi:hypothetical protein